MSCWRSYACKDFGCGATNTSHNIFVVVASSGGIDVLKTLVTPLPASLPASIFVVIHIGRHPTNLDMILDSVGELHASQPHHGEAIREHHIYIAPSEYHMRLQNNAIWLDKGT